MLYFETLSTTMHDVSTHSIPKNIRELFYINLMSMHTTHVSHEQIIFLVIQKSRSHMKLNSFPAFGTRLWNCLHPDWRMLTKRAFKRKTHKLFLTVLEIEDYYVDAHSLILNLNTSNYLNSFKIFPRF